MVSATINPRLRVLVAGGTGFIGRHAVDALLQRDTQVIIGSRKPGRVPTGRSTTETREVRFEDLQSSAAWQAIIRDCDVVLNCVGILRQVGSATYVRVHHRAPHALAEACAAAGKRFIHVSALGLHDQARSRFLTSKLAGEREIRHSGGDWLIVRPSLLDGEGGFGAWWLRQVSRLPLFVVPANAKGQIAALKVEELGEALAALCIDRAEDLRLQESREFDLGGVEHFTLKDYIRRLRTRYTSRAAICVPIPGLLARLIAHVCDLLHFTPFSFGHYELLTRDNRPEINRLPELLGRTPGLICERTTVGSA